MVPMRTIYHLDMDAFFASIEVVLNPALKGKPVIVGGDPNKRGVVSTCSYEARKFGVHSAMSMFEAKRLCPHGIFVKGTYGVYGDYSRRIMDILSKYTYKVQVVSVDEAYMDVSDLMGDEWQPKTLARRLKEDIFSETQLTCSVGIATNKLVAKVASSLAKPNGLYEIPAGQEAAFLGTLDIGKIPGIGKRTQQILKHDGIHTIAQLQMMDQSVLIDRYGARGYQFSLAAQGYDKRPVRWVESAPKSIGAERTFEKDLTDVNLLQEVLKKLVDKVCRSLHEQGMRTRGITLKLRDLNFKTKSYSETFFSHTNTPETILREVLRLFRSVYQGEVPLRLVGVTLEKLSDSYWQPTLWDWEQPPLEVDLI